MKVAKVCEYVHPAMGQEIRATGGAYEVVKEGTLSDDGRSVLYHVVVAQLDTSCCGAGGCVQANVAGELVAPHGRPGPAGRAVSLVRPIDQPAAQARITRALRQAEGVGHVSFWSPPAHPTGAEPAAGPPPAAPRRG